MQVLNCFLINEYFLNKTFTPIEIAYYSYIGNAMFGFWILNEKTNKKSPTVAVPAGRLAQQHQWLKHKPDTTYIQ